MGAGPGEVGLCGTQGKEGDGPQNTGSQVLSLEDAGAPGERCHGRGQNSGGGFQGEMDCGNPVEGLSRTTVRQQNGESRLGVHPNRGSASNQSQAAFSKRKEAS